MPPHGGRTETLDYIQTMLGQLRSMAKAQGCDMLAYLIEMAYLEVHDIIQGERALIAGKEKRDSAS